MEAFREFAVQARESGGKVNELADKLIQDADTMSRLMVTLEEAVRKVESGKGTLGKMLNDPQLYQAMVAATDQLTDVLAEAHQLLETWRQAGIELKLK
jgi:uncharacterized phage infection (PIP) family protein YhgE